MLKSLKITDIKVGHRHRKEMGDLTSLADSIRQDGFLQPIGVTEKLELVFGERRLRAHRDILKKKTILARIVDVPSIIAGEYAENEIRKDFTPSERVAIAKAIEKQVGKRQGQRTDKLRGKIPEVVPGKRTRETAANKAGFGNDKTYRQAAKVVQNGTAKLIHAMDSGRVSISAASILADADPDEQDTIVELDEKAILQAAREIRQRKVPEYSNVWLTPPKILEALAPFELDPCACVNRPWDTATKHFTEKENGLKKRWVGRVWLNPPYGEIEKWMKKLADHGNGIALVYTRTDANWFFDFVWKRANGLLFLRGRVPFLYPDGKTVGNSIAPSVLVSYDATGTGYRNLNALKHCGLDGKFVRLRPDL